MTPDRDAGGRDMTDPTDASEQKMIVPDEEVEETIRAEDIPGQTGQSRPVT